MPLLGFLSLEGDRLQIHYHDFVVKIRIIDKNPSNSFGLTLSVSNNPTSLHSSTFYLLLIDNALHEYLIATCWSIIYS